MAKTRLFRSSIAFGICAKVDPYSKEAAKILNGIEPKIKVCSMPDCKNKAVRVGIFDQLGISEFRGLCERHKRTGMWGGEDKYVLA